MIKNFIFDWGGVLSVSQHDEAVMRFKALGLPNADSYFEEGKNWGGIFGQIESGEISPDEFLKEISLLCGKPISFAQVAYAWWGFFYHLSPGILPKLKKWRAEGYHIYILTNNNPFMMSYIRSDEFAPEGKPFYSYFDHIYVSCDLGLAKPDERIYQHVLKDGDMQPEETIFIDDRAQNLDGAQKVGMHTFLVKDSKCWTTSFERFVEKMNTQLGKESI